MINYTKKEEIINSSSHGFGILLGVVIGIIFLIWCFRAGDGWARTGVILYLFGMLASYVTSTVYHALPQHMKAKEVLRRFDHAAIYWHIAGSYSPITLIAMRDHGIWGWLLFCFVWRPICGPRSPLRRSRSSCRTHRLQAAARQRQHSSSGVDSSRGRLLHHWCTFLQPQQTAIHAQRVPLLRPRRKHLPHHCRMGHPHAISDTYNLNN